LKEGDNVKIKVALAQLNIEFANPQANQVKVKAAVSAAAQENVDVVVFPEMWNTGYALDQLGTLADEDGKKTQAVLARLAGQFDVNIVGGSVATKRGDQFFNTTYVVDRLGQVVADYDKVHLFGLMNEDRYLTAGDKENYFRLAGVPSASFICYDLRFPEWVRTVARHGTDILYFSAEWPAKRIAQWKLMLQARAIENQAFVVAVNRVGDDPDNHFNGHSLVIDPLGRIIVDAGETETIAYAVVDLDQLAAVRGPIPVFSDRRPPLYH
jgi:predicted amidohydrolase